jgi:hypothetical protein
MRDESKQLTAYSLQLLPAHGELYPLKSLIIKAEFDYSYIAVCCQLTAFNHEKTT